MQGCLARAAAEDRTLLRHERELKAFCAGESRSTCESASSCLAAQDDSQFYGCLSLARQQADEERAVAIMWLVAVAILVAAIVSFWWRRPLRRVMARAADRLRNTGAP